MRFKLTTTAVMFVVIFKLKFYAISESFLWIENDFKRKLLDVS